MSVQHKTTRQIIRSFEAKAMKKRPWALRIADRLTSSFGSISFLVGNVVFFTLWILINGGYLTSVIQPFDPFPFILLTMVVSLEAIFLTVVVLMSQNRQSYISSVRDELILQTNLIAERELTKALQLLSGVKHAHDPELEAMLKDTDISYIERKLEEQLQPTPPKTFQKIVDVIQTPLNGGALKEVVDTVRTGNGKGK